MSPAPWPPPMAACELERLCGLYPNIGRLLIQHLFFAGMRCAYLHKNGAIPGPLLEALKILESPFFPEQESRNGSQG
jgi:hypothetical protein